MARARPEGRLLRSAFFFAAVCLAPQSRAHAQQPDAGVVPVQPVPGPETLDASVPDAAVPDAEVTDAAVSAEPAPAAAEPAPAPAPVPEEAAPEEPQADETEDARSLNTVVVTARYRKEDAQKVPIAITTLGSDQLRSLGGTRNLNQLVGQLPSLNIQGYSGRNQTITIRGIGTNAGSTNDGLEQGVGLYIDGVYRPRTGSAITDLMDIESIQLLRGPQGTLFGKNTVAGAVDIHTIEPSFTRSVSAEASYGNYQYARAYFSINNPINDELTFKLSYLRTSRGGLIYNTVYKEDWDDLNNDAVRADVLWKPSDKFKTRLIADYSMQRGNTGFQLPGRALPTTLNDGSTVTGFYDHARAVGYNPIPLRPFARRTDIDANEQDRMPSWGLQNRADYRFDNDVSLTSITAYRQWQWLPHFDGDQFGADVSPVGIVTTHQQQFSQELRLSSPGDQVIDYTAGLYYFWQEADDDQTTSYGSQAAGWLRPGVAPEVLNGLSAFSHVIPATQSYAAYGQATWNVNDKFHITGGLRFTFEHKTGKYWARPEGNAVPLDTLPEDTREASATLRNSYAPTSNYKKSRDVANLSWTGIAAYDITDDAHVFATYSHGYKSPGINLVAPQLGVDVFIKPEVVDDFEVGAKLSFLDGRFEINPALFYIFDDNYQANTVSITQDNRRLFYIANVGKLVSRGAELDVRLFPMRGLTGSASLTLTDAIYDDYKNAPAQYLVSSKTTASQDLSGRRAAGSSNVAAGANVEYYFPVAHSGANPIDAFLGANWSYRSSFYAAVNLDPFSRVPQYHLLGLNVGVRQGTRWDLSFWMRNVLNTNYYSSIQVAANYGITQVSIGEPRMFGVTLRGKLD